MLIGQHTAVYQSIVTFRATLIFGFFIALVRVLLYRLLVGGSMFCHTSNECSSLETQSQACPQLGNWWKKSHHNNTRSVKEGRGEIERFIGEGQSHESKQVNFSGKAGAILYLSRFYCFHFVEIFGHKW